MSMLILYYMYRDWAESSTGSSVLIQIHIQKIKITKSLFPTQSDYMSCCQIVSYRGTNMERTELAYVWYDMCAYDMRTFMRCTCT